MPELTDIPKDAVGPEDKAYRQPDTSTHHCTHPAADMFRVRSAECDGSTYFTVGEVACQMHCPLCENICILTFLPYGRALLLGGSSVGHGGHRSSKLETPNLCRVSYTEPFSAETRSTSMSSSYILPSFPQAQQAQISLWSDYYFDQVETLMSANSQSEPKRYISRLVA